MSEKYLFLSYSSENIQDAETLRNIFIENGIQVWMAKHSIGAGEDFSTVIDQAIDKCTCFVLLLTDEAQSSPWVPRELELAITSHKPIVPVQRKPVTLTNSFHFSLINTQIITLPSFEATEHSTQQFVATVKNYMNGKFRSNFRKIRQHSTSAIGKAWGIIALAAVILFAFLFVGSIVKQVSNLSGNGSSFSDIFDRVSNDELPTPSPTDVNQIPDFLEGKVNELRYADELTVRNHTKHVKVGEYISLPSSWDNYVLYSENTGIALPEDNLVKGVSPGSTYVVKAASKSVCTVYLIIVEE